MATYIDPTKETFAAFRANDRLGPIHMLNLVRLRDQASYPDGRSATGAEAYAAYGRESYPVFSRLGGRIVWRGVFELMLIGASEEQWDECFIAEYPSVAAFVKMIRDPAYREAVKHRQAAVLDSRLIRLAPAEHGSGYGGRKRGKTKGAPSARDPVKAWGHVPTDKHIERKRLARIVTRKGRRIVDYRGFIRELGAACHAANWDLYERARSDWAVVDSILTDLEGRLAEARAALLNLGPDATKALQISAARQDPRPPKDNGETAWQWLEPPGLQSGANRVRWVDRIMADCESWASAARKDIVLPGRGRPPDIVTKELVSRLAELWQMHTNERPTLSTDPISRKKSGDFLEFCSAVIGPIWCNRKQKIPSTEDFVKDILYPGAKGNKNN